MELTINVTANLTVLALTSSVAIIALILLGLRKALNTAGWTISDRERVTNVFAIGLIGWFLIATVSRLQPA